MKRLGQGADTFRLLVKASERAHYFVTQRNGLFLTCYGYSTASAVDAEALPALQPTLRAGSVFEESITVTASMVDHFSNGELSLEKNSMRSRRGGRATQQVK